MKDYYEISVSINPNAIELATEVFFERFECEGVVQAEEKYKDLELIETTNNIAKGYVRFETDEFSPKEVQQIFTEAKEELKEEGFTDEELGSWKISAQKVINQDWSQKWKEHWKPTKASEHVIICPSWEECSHKNDEVLITLDPGSAFGTGTHATTQLCIQAIEKYLKKGDEAADIGTGSGILAITAIKFGATHAVAIDNDPLVIDVAKDNAQVNGVFNRIDFSHATADMLTEQYDFICANILHNILAEIMGDLKNIMKPEAHMVLSGILDEKKQTVLDAVEKHNLKVIEILSQDQWVAIVVQKID
ncbi:MAG: 50S ribosomal protein L11 methyltransferase [Clostridium sp.]|nr:50S ribosomal protein L11 methyltransferase [Clostridium sp.]